MKLNKEEKIKKRYPALGIVLLLVVGICAGMLILDKYSKKFNVVDKIKETVPGWLSNVLGSEETNPEVSGSSPASQNTNTQSSPKQTSSQPSSQTQTQQTQNQVQTLSQTVPCPSPNLSPAEVEKIRQTILGSDFVKDLPKKGVISLTFFNFCNGNRIIQNNFLIGKNEILSSGEPDIYLTLHSKYISQLNGNNLCEVIKTANANRDLGMDSDLSNAKLMLKYAGLLKYRECFGF